MTVALEGLRKQKGLSRAAVAAKLDLSERHVYRLERGQTPLKRLHALALAEVYEVDVRVVENAAAGCAA